MRTTAYLKAIMEVYGKIITGLGPVVVDSLFHIPHIVCQVSVLVFVLLCITLCHF